MESHNFTPKQTEMILNAVAELMRIHGNAHLYAKRLTDLTMSYIQDNITNQDNLEGEHKLTLNALYLSDLLCDIQYLSDFFYAIDIAIDK